MSLQHLSTCPACSGTNFEPYLEVKDHSVSHGTFKLVTCKKCRLIFTNPRPPEEEIGTYYDSESYISHHDDTGTLFSRIYQGVRKVALKSKLNLVGTFDREHDKEILDIGCGTGAFLEACKSKNWNITGTEPDHDARSLAIRKTGAAIFESVFHPGFPEKNFSSITLWHVLEHIHRLEETMDWIHRHLRPKGVLFIAVPNAQSYDAARFGPYWAAYDVPRHLYHFTKESMEKLLHHHSFALREVRCMLFDSYYVSLLSNQYKYGKSRVMDSFITGTLSNLKGFGTNIHNANASSLIYIVQKK